MGRTWILFAAVALGGCASKQYYRYDYAADAMPKVARPTVLLNPTVRRLSVAKPSAASLSALDAELAAHLEAAGYTVDTSTRSLVRLAPVTRALPLASMVPLAESFAPLGEDGVCDVVVIPTIEERACEAQSQTCRWDGVLRDIPSSNDTSGVWRGALPAASLSVRAYSCDGREILHSMGGLDVALYATTRFSSGQDTASPMAGTASSVLAIRSSGRYLDDPAKRAEAIALALHPMVAMQGYPSKPTYYDPTKVKSRPRRGKSKARESIFRGKTKD